MASDQKGDLPRPERIIEEPPAVEDIIGRLGCL